MACLCGEPGAAAALREAMEHKTVLIDGAPEPKLRSGDRNDDFVHMPSVIALRSATAELVCEFPPEFVGPLADGFGGDVDATGGEHLLDHAQAEGEAEMEPERQCDDLAREAMTTVSDEDEDAGIPPPPQSGALMHNSTEGRASTHPGQTHAARCVTDAPRAVKRLGAATRM